MSSKRGRRGNLRGDATFQQQRSKQSARNTPNVAPAPRKQLIDQQYRRQLRVYKFKQGIIKLGRKYGKPIPMTEEDIQDVINRFVFTAKIARESGFDGIQLHSAHGYLLSQFLSPDINQRTDAWGGSLENRARIHLEIIKK